MQPRSTLRTAGFLALTAFFLPRPAAAKVDRVVIIKVDGLPERLLERYARPGPDGHARLASIAEVFGRNGASLENFYTRGISLSAPSWSMLDTGRHLVIHGNVEYDRYTLRPWDYLNFFPFYVTYAVSKHADMPGVELLDQAGVPMLIDRFPSEQRYQSFQLFQRGIRWLTLQRGLRQRFTSQPLKDLFDEWQIGFSFSKSVYESTERDILRNLMDPNVRYLDYFTGDYDHEAHLTNDRVAQLSVLESLDALVGRLWGAIGQSPLANTTALVLVSDHGMNTSETSYSQGYNLVDWFNSSAGGAQHVITDRHPLTEFKLKGLDPFVSEVITPSKEATYLAGKSNEYPTVVLDLDGNERANIGLRENTINILQILLGQLTQKKLSGPMRVAVLQACFQVLDRARPRLRGRMNELREELAVLRNSIDKQEHDKQEVAGNSREKRPKLPKDEKDQEFDEAARHTARLNRWKAEEREGAEYLATMERLLALTAADFDPGKFRIEEVIPRKSLGELNTIYDLQHYVTGPSSEGMVLDPTGLLDFGRSFRVVNYFDALSSITVRNNVQKGVANKPVDFIAVRVPREELQPAMLERTLAKSAAEPTENAALEDGIWLRGGDGKQALILTRHDSRGELELRYVPVEHLVETESGQLRFELCDFGAGAPLQLFEDEAITASKDWLLEWHGERDWLNAVHRSKYSNGIIGLTEQLLDPPDQPEPRRLARLRTDLLVFANDHWNFNVRGFNPGGNHGSLLRVSTHSVLMIAGGKDTGIPKGMRIETPYDSLSFTPTILKLMEKSDPGLPGPVIQELVPKH